MHMCAIEQRMNKRREYGLKSPLLTLLHVDSRKLKSEDIHTYIDSNPKGVAATGQCTEGFAITKQQGDCRGA